ncbi:PIN domain-containing protein [Streptomyces sp. ME02-8801-2C]|uniref:type II toxin-antitoxin system VapC family toxin n=1 Tax=Streptomyces sp. ME02-8801-2C TaxID=3028680 RepID=UPI0029AA88ED|nr:PIN domain-containing protein [Streptomyces sp. ME02-8801-2C]MDX3456951.1 PIN domain-containing protein [Streptomyces sp. ME02-8801-2C]
MLLLDSEGLSKTLSANSQATAFIAACQAEDMLIAVSNLTLIEAWHDRVRMDRFQWLVSRLQVLPVTEPISWRAIELLKETRLHGHKYAIDAVVAATALGHPGPRIILTSDVDDMKRLCGEKVQVEEI